MVDSSYVFKDTLDIEKLFVHVDVTQEVKALQKDIPTYLATFKTVLENNNEPQIKIGQHCFKPYTCDAYNYCWTEQNHIPSYSVFNIFSMGKKPLELFESGIVNVEDIPEEKLTTENQKWIVDAWKTKATRIDQEAIDSFIHSLRYPLYYLDFETYMDAVPNFNGQRPYQQICFQYSLHVEDTNGILEHKEFLAKELGDPRESFILSLLRDVPQDACILVYNENFEKTRIKELARDFPAYADKLMNLFEHIIDLAEPFQKKHYYDYNFKGKYSIKLVMPLLAPHMADAYKQLKLVRNGGDAMNTFPKLKQMIDEEKASHKEALLRYCELDTLSMVEILKKLKEYVR
jgi:hypothetical protein